MAYEVNIEREEKPASTVQTYTVTTDEGVVFKARFSESKLERLSDRVKKNITELLPYLNVVEEAVYEKLKVTVPDDEPFQSGFVKPMSEIIQSIALRLCQDQEWDQIKSPQTQLE